LLAREGSYSVGTTARGRRSVDEGEKEGGTGEKMRDPVGERQTGRGRLP
jgi:hypothetical protein